MRGFFPNHFGLDFDHELRRGERGNLDMGIGAQVAVKHLVVHHAIQGYLASFGNENRRANQESQGNSMPGIAFTVPVLLALIQVTVTITPRKQSFRFTIE